MKSSLMRARWAAVGSALAVALGGGVVMVANAGFPGAGASNELNYISIPTCRILDTRDVDDLPGPDIGPYSKLGNGTVRYVDVDDVANNVTCAGIPTSGLEAAMLNITAVNPTEASFLVVFPGSINLSSPQPSAPFAGSNVNFGRAAGPTANQAVVRLGTRSGDDGIFGIYNHDGAVDVVIDLVGFYTYDSNIDPRFCVLDTDPGPGFTAELGIYEECYGGPISTEGAAVIPENSAGE